MKCALCGKEIRGRDYINASTVHSMPCEWYDFERDTVQIGMTLPPFEKIENDIIKKRQMVL